MKKEYEVLFTPFKIGNLEIPNRFVMCPMEPTALIEWTSKPVGYDEAVHDLIVERAKDGIGLIIPGALAVYSLANRMFIGDHPEAFRGISDLMDEVHSYGSKLFMQISAGLGRNLPVAKQLYENYDKLNPVMKLDLAHASADAGLPNRWINDLKTTELAKEDIEQLVEEIAKAALLCKENGVDGIDVHAVHEGYLLDQFATKYTNHRTDEYGGSLENRLRFACDVVKAIKKKCGQDYPVILRYSVTSRVKDFNKGIIPADTVSTELGRDMAESREAIQILSKAGYDGFNADNGTYDSWYYAHPPVYMPLNCNLKESIAIKPYTDKPIICAGRMQLHEAAEAISNGQLDFVGIGRQFLTDELYLTKIRNDEEEDVRPCISCHVGCMGIGLWKDSGAYGEVLGTCALNPRTHNEKKYQVIQTNAPKHFAVIGGGIAGMEFALQAAKRGHQVDLYEKTDRLGGVFNEAASFSFKEKDRELIEYYKTQIKKSSVCVHIGTEIGRLEDIEADEYIIATGSAGSRKLAVPGSEHCVDAIEFLKNGMRDCDNPVIIGGGLTGCEIAYELALNGKHPQIVEMLDDILKVPGSCMANTSYLRDAFEFYKVPVYTEAKTVRINPDSVVIEKDGAEITLSADKTIVSIGYNAGHSLVEGEHVHVLGDACKVGNLCTAILAANDLIMKLN